MYKDAQMITWRLGNYFYKSFTIKASQWNGNVIWCWPPTDIHKIEERCSWRPQGHDRRWGLSVWQPPTPLVTAVAAPHATTFPELIIRAWYSYTVQKGHCQMATFNGCTIYSESFEHMSLQSSMKYESVQPIMARPRLPYVYKKLGLLRVFMPWIGVYHGEMDVIQWTWYFFSYHVLAD